MAGLWLKAPWSDFCLSTRGFLQVTALHPICRSREKTIRPIRGEPLLQWGTDVDGKAAAEEDGHTAGWDVQGRGCGLLDTGVEE